MLVVEDGSFVSGANSMASLDEADEFLTMFGDCWCGSKEEKERHLKLANYMMMANNWHGNLANDGQGTPFPRLCAYDACNLTCGHPTEIAGDEIPQKVKQAQMLLAMGLCSGGISPFTNNNRGVVSSFDGGGVSITFEEGKGVHMDDIHGGNCEMKAAACDPMPQIKGLLACFIKSNGFGNKIRSVNARVIQRSRGPSCK